MEKFEIAFLGAAQGVTEFFPVSSTAHIMIFAWLFSWKDGGLDLAVWLHAGTLLAIFICFRKDWALIVRALYRSSVSGSVKSAEARMGAGLLITALPAVAAGFLFEYAIAGILRQPLVVSGGLIAGSAALFIADAGKEGTKRLSGVSIKDCVFFGIAQSFALVPGVSRAGASIAGGMFLGYRREDSAKFAFMMGVPAICAAIAHRVWRNGFTLPLDGEVIAGAAAATVTGIFAIRFLLSFARRGSYTPFVIYRLAVAAVLIFVFI